MSVLDDVRFWAAMVEEQRRILMCPPNLTKAVTAKLTELGLAHLHEVQESPHMPEDQIWVVDPNAMEGAFRQASQMALKGWRR